MNCIFVLTSTRSYLRTVLPKIVPTLKEDEGNSLSPSRVYYTAHNIHFTLSGLQATFRSLQETYIWTIRLTLWWAALTNVIFV